MTAKYRREKPQLNASINVTNLVDVMLTILIMYIIVAPFIDKGINVALPKSSTKEHVPPHEVVLTVSKDKNIYIGELKVTAEELEKKLRSIAAANADITVNLQGDSKTEYQSIVDVLDIVRRSGITNIGLATEAKVEKR